MKPVAPVTSTFFKVYLSVQSVTLSSFPTRWPDDRPAMRALSTTRQIDAPARVVWRLIAEFELWPSWGPTVNDVITEASVVAPGVQGLVVTPVGVSLPFVITRVEPGASWYWRVAGVKATGHRVIATGPETCRLEFSVPWPFAAYIPILRLGLAKVKSLAESGQID